MLKKYTIWGLILFFSIFYSTYSVIRHLRFETYIFDLGYYDQLIWLVSQGKPLFSSILEAHPFVDHFSPSIFLLAPLYWIWQSPLMLLIFQAVFICLGAYPVYRLGLKKTKSNLFSVTVSFAYLMFYGFQNAIAFDFHPVALGPTLLAFIFWFYEEKKFRHFWISLLIFVGLQENFFILTSALGVFLVFKYKDFKKGLPIFLGGLLITLLLLFLIIPNLFGSKYYYVPNHFDELSIGNLIKMLYNPSSKIDVVVFALTAFGFLPILSPVFFILLGEEFLGRFLGTTNPNWWILGFHYNAILAPILAFAAMETALKFFRKRVNLAVSLIILGTLVSQFRVKTDVYKVFDISFYDLSATKNAREVIKEIPKNASVAATNDLGAQIARRQDLIFLTNCIENTEIWGPDGKRCFKLKPDYILANMGLNVSPNNFYPDYDRDSIWRYLDYVQKNGEYTLIKKSGEVYLLKRN